MGDAASGCHEVEFAGAHDVNGAHRVAMLDLPRKEPAHGLQPDVWVRGDVHSWPWRRDRGGVFVPGGIGDLIRRERGRECSIGHRHGVGGVLTRGSVVIQEAPGTDEGARALGNRAPYMHRARPPERHEPMLEHLESPLRRRGTMSVPDRLDWARLGVTHGLSLGRAPHKCEIRPPIADLSRLQEVIWLSYQTDSHPMHGSTVTLGRVARSLPFVIYPQPLPTGPSTAVCQ